MVFGLTPEAAYRLKTVLQVAIPTIVAADTLHSFYRCHLLWRARVKEWEDEDNQRVHGEVVQTLRRVVQRCEGERDFFPSSIAQAFAGASAAAREQCSSHGVAESSADIALRAGDGPEAGGSGSGGSELPVAAAVEQAVADAAAFLQGLGLALLEVDAAGEHSSCPPAAFSSSASTSSRDTGDAGAAAAAPAPAAAPAASAAAEPPLLDPYSKEAQEAREAAAAAAASAQGGWWGTLRLPDAASLKSLASRGLAALRALTQPADLAAGLQASLAQQYSAGCGRVEGALAAAAERLRAWGKGRVPWPCARLSRRSALRYRVEWHGLAWPEPRSKACGLELVLDGL